MNKCLHIIIKLILLGYPFVLIYPQNARWHLITEEEVDSVNTVLSGTYNDTLKMQACRDLAFYWKTINLDSSLYYHEKQLAFAKLLRIKIWESDAWGEIGFLAMNKRMYTRSIASFNESLRIAGNQKNEKSNWRVYNFWNARDYHEARLARLAISYHDLSWLYGWSLENSKQISATLRAKEIAEGVDNESVLTGVYSQLGAVYNKNNFLDSAIFYYKKAMKVAEISGIKKYYGNYLHGISEIFFKKGELDSAKRYALESVAVQDDKIVGTPKVLVRLSKIYVAMNKLDSGLYYARLGFEESQRSGLKTNILRASSNLADLYKLLNNLDSAYRYAEMSRLVNDELTTRHTEELNEYQQIVLHEQLKSKELEERGKRNILFFLAACIILVILGIIFQLWQKKDFRQKLRLEQVRQRIAADLHDEIGSNLSSMVFSAELVKKKLQGTRQDIDPILNNLVHNFRETSALISDTIWSLNPRNDAFDKLKERMEGFTHEILSLKEIDYQFGSNGQNHQPDLSLEQKRNIYLIYKEAINNIAKHSKASKVNIRMEQFPEKLVIEVADNGIGFDTAEDHQGNGLNNFKTRSGKESCEVHYSSVPGKGTVVTITVFFKDSNRKQPSAVEI